MSERRRPPGGAVPTPEITVRVLGVRGASGGWFAALSSPGYAPREEPAVLADTGSPTWRPIGTIAERIVARGWNGRNRSETIGRHYADRHRSDSPHDAQAAQRALPHRSPRRNHVRRPRRVTQHQQSSRSAARLLAARSRLRRHWPHGPGYLHRLHKGGPGGEPFKPSPPGPRVCSAEHCVLPCRPVAGVTPWPPHRRGTACGGCFFLPRCRRQPGRSGTS